MLYENERKQIFVIEFNGELGLKITSICHRAKFAIGSAKRRWLSQLLKKFRLWIQYTESNFATRFAL